MIQPVNNIVELFLLQAQKNPSRTAIVFKGQEVSFGDLEKSVRSTATYFKSKGVGKGDRVLVFIPMSTDLYRTVLALFYIGATAVFLDEWVGIKRMRECCKVANCKGFIGIWKAEIIGWFVSEIRNIPIHLNVKQVSENINAVAHEKTLASDTALITFTTGSTGIPKAAKRTHGFLFEQFRILVDELQPKENEIDMPVLPIVLLINLGTGVTSVIADFKASQPDSLKPEKIINQITRHNVSRIISSPFFVKQISKYVIERKVDLQSLKKIFTGGAPVFPKEAELYIKAFPAANINVVYGSTESEPISRIQANELLKSNMTLKTGLNVGSINSEIKLRIIKIKDSSISINNEKELLSLQTAAGEIGEIIVTGPHVLKEYYNSEEAFKQNKIFIHDQVWHRTGDSGYIGNDDNLYLTGRCNTLIPYKGKILAPFIYENLLQSINGIEFATILLINKRLIIVVELTEIQVKSKLENDIKQLDIEFDDLLFLKKIPRDPRHNSKIDYMKLKSVLSNKI